MRVWFVVPAHGREALTRVCLRQLARTCEAADVDATAVVIGEGENLEVAQELGFATVRRGNNWLGQKLNDGYQLACDPAFNPEPADYVIPCGSDDWVDPQILQRLPGPNELGVFRQVAIVNEDRTLLARMRMTHPGGAGIRIIPRALVELTGFRPAEEDRRVGLDNSTVRRLHAPGRRMLPCMVDLDQHALQIVDWKTQGEQLHSYKQLQGFRRGVESSDPFAELAGVYPAEAIEEMRALA